MTITTGILIALSLEGTLEWFHQGALVREAKENIAAELHDNRQQVEDFLKAHPKMMKQQAELFVGGPRRLPPGDPDKASPAEIGAWRQRIIAARTQLDAEANLAKALRSGYGKLPAGR